nr:hypothetical protein BaRGS_032586 [Batillaria attramentaria]
MRVIHTSVRVGFSSRRFEPIHEIGRDGYVRRGEVYHTIPYHTISKTGQQEKGQYKYLAQEKEKKKKKKKKSKTERKKKEKKKKKKREEKEEDILGPHVKVGVREFSPGLESNLEMN